MQTFFWIFLLLFIPAAQAQVSQSTIDDQKSVELTVYNSSLGLVKDVRDVKLPKGQGELRFMDVASAINPVTVKAESLTKPKEFRVLDQNYEFDLMNEQRLLDKYVGKTLKIQRWGEDVNQVEEKEAVLLSNNEGQVYRIDNEIYLDYPGIKILPSLPEDLIAKPTLTWTYTNQSSKPHQLEVSYLTGGISWKADYVVTLAADDASLDLSGWVTIDNQSGAAYRNARLKLIAGEVNRVYEKFGVRRDVMMMQPAAMEAMGGPQFEEKAFFEYHIYDLQRQVTIKDRQIKQINLLEAPGVKASKELLVQGQAPNFFYAQPGQPQKLDVQVNIKFKNSKENQAGMPLPEGILRVYKKDSDGSLQFIGEDRIEHTPKDEEVTMKIGKAFDVVAERIQTDYEQVSQRVHETEWEISVRNHKKGTITIGLEETLYGDWKIVSHSHPYEKKDAATLRFNLSVAPDKEEKVKYRVRVTSA
jgi:hypothetical protein